MGRGVRACGGGRGGGVLGFFGLRGRRERDGGTRGGGSPGSGTPCPLAACFWSLSCPCMRLLVSCSVGLAVLCRLHGRCAPVGRDACCAARQDGDGRGGVGVKREQERPRSPLTLHSPVYRQPAFFHPLSLPAPSLPNPLPSTPLPQSTMATAGDLAMWKALGGAVKTANKAKQFVAPNGAWRERNCVCVWGGKSPRRPPPVGPACPRLPTPALVV